MSTLTIWLICIFAYPILWVIFSSVMTVVTFIDYTIDPPHHDKFGLKGSIQFWWMIPGFAPFYLLNLIFHKPLTYFSNKREKKKQYLFYTNLIERIKNLKIGEEFSEQYEDFEFCIFRKLEYYTIGVFCGSCKKVEVFKSLEYALKMIGLTTTIKYQGITFYQFERKIDILAFLDQHPIWLLGDEDIKIAKEIIEDDLIERLKQKAA